MRVNRRHQSTLVETAIERRQRRLEAFGETHREQLAELARPGSPLEDLADSFPALLFALATGYGEPAAREAARQAALKGASLKTLAKLLDLPLWMRHVSPGALSAPLPRLPGDAEFSTAAVARIPATDASTAAWLARTATALDVAGHEAAMWVMKNPRFLPPATSLDELLWVLAWVWHSMRPWTAGGRLVRRHWSPSLGWSRARDEVAIWRKRLDLAAAIGKGIDDPWFEDGHALGLDFVALRTVDDFIAESRAMENCLDQYASQLLHGQVRIFSLRKAGRPVANLELAIRPDEASVPGIAQLRGRRNRQASLLFWQAAHAWLGAQRFAALVGRPKQIAEVKTARAALWGEFLSSVHDPAVARRLRTIVLGVDKPLTVVRTSRMRIHDTETTFEPARPFHFPAMARWRNA